MSDEPDWIKVYQDCQQGHAETYLAFAQANAQRDPAHHDQLKAKLANLFNAGSTARPDRRAGLAKLAAALCEDSSFLHDRGPSPEDVRLLEDGLEAARALNDTGAICSRLNSLGETLRLGPGGPAIALHAEALSRRAQPTTWRLCAPRSVILVWPGLIEMLLKLCPIWSKPMEYRARPPRQLWKLICRPRWRPLMDNRDKSGRRLITPIKR